MGIRWNHGRYQLTCFVPYANFGHVNVAYANQESSVVNTSTTSCCHQRHTHEPVNCYSYIHSVRKAWDSLSHRKVYGGICVWKIRAKTRPANTRHSPNAVLTVAHCLRRWPNIKTASGECLVLFGRVVLARCALPSVCAARRESANSHDSRPRPTQLQITPQVGLYYSLPTPHRPSETIDMLTSQFK